MNYLSPYKEGGLWMIPKKLEKVILTVTFIITSIILLLVSLWLIYKLSLVDDKRAMEKYLEEKYGTEFVIKDFGYFWASIGNPTEVQGIVYPKNDKDLVFEVNKFVDDEEGEYREDYLRLLWSKQAQNDKELKEYFQTHFNLVPEYGVLIGYAEKIEDEIHGKTPNFSKEFLKKYGKGIGFYIDIRVKGDIDGDSIKQHAEQVWKALGYFKERPYIKDPALLYVINTNSGGFIASVSFKASEIEKVKSSADVLELMEKELR